MREQKDDAAAALAERAWTAVPEGIVLFELAPGAGGSVDAWRVALANPAAERLAGRPLAGTAAEALGATLGLADLPVLVARAAQAGTAAEALRRCDGVGGEAGGPRWLRVVAVPAGREVALTVSDVTDIRCDFETRRGQAFLCDAIDQLNQGFALWDSDDRLVLCNATYRQAFSAAEALLLPGTAYADVLGRLARCGTFPDARGGVEAWLEARLAEHRTAGRTFEQRLADGRWLQVAECRTGDGGILGLFTDITALKQAEARIHDAVDSAPEGFALWDAAGCLVLCNERFRDGFEPVVGALVPGTAFETVLREAIAAGVFAVEGDAETWIAARLDRFGHADDLFEQTLADGRVFHVSERRTRDGGVVSVRIDVTELKRRENQARREGEQYKRYLDDIALARSKLERQGAALVRLAEDLFFEKEKAESASVRKTQFLANLSHELRTPMNAILGFAEVLKLEMFGPLGSARYVEYANDIYESGAHLLDLINDVLDMSKIEAGKKELEPESVDAAALATECLNLVYERAEKGAVALVSTVSDDFPAVWADRRALKQCLLNLLTNGIKFTPRGGTVSVGARLDGDIQAITVTDTGIGIPAEDLPRLANPFVRARAPRRLAAEGTGLGLALSRSLLELHGGTLSIDSTVGVGTTVTMRLPLRTA